MAEATTGPGLVGHMRSWAIGGVLAATFLVASALPAGATTTPQPGIGSTTSAWKHAYGTRSKLGSIHFDKNACFGGLVNDATSGHTCQFTSVDFAPLGLAGGYAENFPNRTTLATVENALKRTLPKDASFGPVVVDTTGGSCGLIAITSPTIARRLGSSPKTGDPSGIVDVELSRITTNLDTVYSPTNIQTAQVTDGPINSPTSAC